MKQYSNFHAQSQVISCSLFPTPSSPLSLCVRGKEYKHTFPSIPAPSPPHFPLFPKKTIIRYISCRLARSFVRFIHLTSIISTPYSFTYGPGPKKRSYLISSYAKAQDIQDIHPICNMIDFRARDSTNKTDRVTLPCVVSYCMHMYTLPINEDWDCVFFLVLQY